MKCGSALKLISLGVIGIVCQYLLLCASPANAGSWTVTSSASATANAPTAPPPAHGNMPANYATNEAGLGDALNFYYGSQGNYGGNFSGSLSDTITVTFTWTPAQGQNSQTDPPPAKVCVEETASANWSGSVSSTNNKPVSTDASGHCSDGIGDTEIDPAPSGGNSSGSSSGTHCSVQSISGGTYTVTRTLTANASVSTSTTQDGFSDLGMGYGISIAALTISLAGTTNVSGSTEALSGQQIAASISGLPQGTTVSSYAWSLTGATDALADWDQNAPDTNNTTQAVALTHQDKTQPTFYFYDVAADTKVDLDCTASITWPAPDGSTTSASLHYASIAFMKPAASWSPKTGTVQMIGGVGSSSYVFGLYPDPNISPPQGHGMNWGQILLTMA